MLPDINTTLAAALYGVCAAAPRKREEPPLDEATKLQEEEPRNPVAPSEDPAHAPNPIEPAVKKEVSLMVLPQTYRESNQVHRDTVLAAARFLNQYAHTADTAHLSVDETATALATKLRDTPLAELIDIPYRTMVLVFFSVRQALR